MTSDLDIYRSANILIERYGEDAVIEAAMRANAFLDEREMAGYLVWKRIVKAVEEILSEGRRPGEAAH